MKTQRQLKNSLEISITQQDPRDTTNSVKNHIQAHTFRLDLLAVERTLKSHLQHHSSKASILRHSAFFIVQLSHPFSHPYMTTGKTIAFTRWTFVGKVMSLLFNMLSRFVITFLPRSKHLFQWVSTSHHVAEVLKFDRTHSSLHLQVVS